ncbi:MAG TPA: PepSY-associated TM helix domain-containing protein, partial [Opitutaceae bacterium]
TGYADMNAAQQVRSWTRFLHTGEAVGPLGQFLAGLACLGGVFLVYTGFALSWRRFFGKKPPAPAPKPAEAAVAATR